MKVIVASYSKCGTKTLNAALTRLGYNVFDILENFWFYDKEWIEILNSGRGSSKAYKRMFENVDAVCDVPAYHYWKDIHQTFPHAKIILTIRNEEEWFQSYKTQVEKVLNSTYLKLILTIAPSGRRFFRYLKALSIHHFNMDWDNPWHREEVNEYVCKKKYKEHNEDVKENAPKDRLLIYHLEDGWEPLCKFLEVEVPNEDFPRKNVGGKLFNTWMKEHPFALQMQTEMCGIITCLLLLFIGMSLFLYALS